MNLKAPQTPSIKTVFTLTSEGVHTQKDGTHWQVRCFWWTCVQKGCKLDGRPIKEICKGTSQLFRHPRSCTVGYNYKYDWLRPTLEESVNTYTKLYGKESCE